MVGNLKKFRLLFGIFPKQVYGGKRITKRELKKSFCI